MPSILTKHPADSKKGRLKPADEISGKLKWDESFRDSHVLVGYEDRFLGLIAMGLDTFLEPDTGIPMHRIRYFRDQFRLLWDRELRYDGTGVERDENRFTFDYDTLPWHERLEEECPVNLDVASLSADVGASSEKSVVTAKARGATSAADKRKQARTQKNAQKFKVLNEIAKSRLTESSLDNVAREQYIYRCMLQDHLHPESMERLKRIDRFHWLADPNGDGTAAAGASTDDAADEQAGAQGYEQEMEHELTPREDIAFEPAPSSSRELSPAFMISTEASTPPMSAPSRAPQVSLGSAQRLFRDQVLAAYWEHYDA